MSKMTGYWTPKNMRQYLENFVRNRKLDPSLPDTWYHLSVHDLYQSKVLLLMLLFFYYFGFINDFGLEWKDYFKKVWRIF